MANFLTKIFGTHSSHELKKIYPIADKVDALEEQFKKLTDDELRARQTNSSSATRTAKRSTNFCRRHLPPAVKQHGAYSVCVITVYRSSAVSSCIMAVSQR